MNGNNAFKRLLWWGGGAALLAAGYRRFARPASVFSARVTAITPGNPAIANVALRYASGALPARLIVDLADANGSGGSTTVDGDQVLLEVPLAGPPADSYKITTTATYRILGAMWTDTREFRSE